MTTTRILRVNGADLACDIDGDGASVLFIHGLGSHRGDWRAQVAALRDRYRVVRYDVRGHGESSIPDGGYSMPELADDAAEVIRALDLGPVHVVGLSLGGMIGLQLAVDHPTLVRSVTVVNSNPELVPRSVGERLGLWLRLTIAEKFGPGGLGRLLGRRLFPKPEQAALREEFVAHMATNDPTAYVTATRAIVGWSVADRMDQIHCPVLFISGDRDYTPVSRKEAYVRQLRRGQLVVIADSGHATPLDRPAEFNTALLGFLATQDSIGGRPFAA